MELRTCVSPEGRFRFGVHQPGYRVRNLRRTSAVSAIGAYESGGEVLNGANFPEGDIEVDGADRVYEIPNAFPFKGATYISGHFAAAAAENPLSIALPERVPVSLRAALGALAADGGQSPASGADLYGRLPEPLLLALAATSTDAVELAALARMSCRFRWDRTGERPTGMVFEKAADGAHRPAIGRHALFKTLANNPFLPDAYKKAMVLNPGIQGGSRITGEWRFENNGSHVYEYLRANSYIPWGHYAANMAEDAVRYDAADLTLADMRGMRHLYYQRTFVRMAEAVGLTVSVRRRNLTADELEKVRREVCGVLEKRPAGEPPPFGGTLWGWNYGFDYTPGGYRLHGAHQQVHQQYALIPESVPPAPGSRGDAIPAFAVGDLVTAFAREFRRASGVSFFEAYIRAIRENRRTDGNASGPRSLVVHEDDEVMLFVPKAQTSQWELQLMVLGPAGNVLEAGNRTRRALDRAILIAVKVLAAMGARFVTAIEYARRFDETGSDQRLLYAFLPRVPQSPSTFCEAQLRWINRHFPEDFAAACRSRMPGVIAEIRA